jgi:glyoxylase-like metal-dependent hydrolase (beta-lactamase superfamily II)
VHPVVEGVHRIPLPLPLAGLPAVNVYVLEGPDGLVVIDGGWQSPDSRTRLEVGLKELGHDLADIDSFLVTHMHWDHYTMAAALRDEVQCRVLVGEGEADSILGYDPHSPLHLAHVPGLRAVGADSVADGLERRELEPHEVGLAYGAPDAWLRDGDRVALTGGHLEVIATPGHTRGHLVFALEQADVLFTGDHVLSVATPAIGGDVTPTENPLADYLASLEKLLARPDSLMLPAHGPVTDSVHARVRELLQHHEDRLDDVLRLVRAGHRTAHAVATALPWTRHHRALADLDVVHQMFAVLEVEAHLHVLADRGEVGPAVVDGVRAYALAGGAA